MSEESIDFSAMLQRIEDYFQGDEERIKLWYRIKSPILKMSPNEALLNGHYTKLYQFVEHTLINK